MTYQLPEKYQGRMFLKRCDVMDIFGRGETWVHARMKAGDFRYKKDGKSTLIIPQSVIDYANRLPEHEAA